MAKKNTDPNAPAAPKKARKAPFRVTESMKKHLKNALDGYLSGIDALPDHPLVDKGAIVGEIVALRDGLCGAPKTDEPQTSPVE